MTSTNFDGSTNQLNFPEIRSLLDINTTLQSSTINNSLNNVSSCQAINNIISQISSINGNSHTIPTLANIVTKKKNVISKSKATMQNKRGRPNKPVNNRLPMFEELPNDLIATFSDWFYKNIKQKKTPITTPIYLDQQLNLLAQLEPSVNDNSDDLKLLTQDLTDTCLELEPLKKITDYKLTIKEKINKINLNEPESPSKSAQNSDENRTSKSTTNLSKQSRPKAPLNELTLTIETMITTIDYRPMIKKRLKLTDANTKRDGSLIEPDEECDDSEQEDIVEIDCDS